MYDDPIVADLRRMRLNEKDREGRYAHGPISIDDQDGPVISIGEPINVRREPPPDDDDDDGDSPAAVIASAITIIITLFVCIALFGGK